MAEHMIRLTSAFAGDESRPLALNARHVVSVYSIFDGETRVELLNRETEWIVKETFDEVMAQLTASNPAAKREDEVG